MVGSFSFSVRLPFSYGFVLRLLGAFSFPSGFDGWLFRFRLRFLRSGSSFASFRLNGGLRDSSFALRSGWSSVLPLSCSRFVFSARSFALRFSLSDGLCFSSIPFKALFLFRLFALGSASSLFAFP